MKLTLNSKKLLAAINLCQRGISQNNIVPVASCYRFRTIGHGIEISSCNQEISMQTILECTADMVDVLIPADKLKNLLSSLPDQGLTFDISDGFEITITALSGKYSLSGYDGKDFPVIKIETDTEVTIPAEDLSEAIYATSYARSVDQNQPKFTGLSLSFKKDKLTFAGCNLLLLSVFNIKGKFKPGELLLPPGIVSALPELQGDCKISYSKNSICFEYDNLVIKSLLMDEKYPDYMAIVPKNDVKLSVNRTELIAAIKRVLEFSNKTSRQINLSGNLQISGEDTAYKQKAIEKITCEGGLIEINVNGQFLSDALSHFGSEIVEINWQAPDKAIVINEPGDGDNFVMVMAMVNV
jgi:DNA polymerase-3 subunit beta